MDNFSGMIAFQVGGVAQGEAIAERMMKDFEVIHYAVSLGHHRSLCFWMETAGLMQTSFRLEGKQLESYRAFAGDEFSVCRWGLEDWPTSSAISTGFSVRPRLSQYPACRSF
ncbi:MAG: hypothetical protein R3D29_10175 [Nitratireductor sp.]